MQLIQFKTLGIALIPLALSACGGGTTTSLTTIDSTNSVTDSNTTTTEGDAGQNSGNTGGSTEPAGAGAALSGTTVDGRVADGYLQGATICVDVNENGSCDDDEPQTTSGTGGAYSLNIPDDAAGKPIVADVPATAIDEDTNEPIGKKLVFSTPGDKPSFVSPITTMVHQVLKNDPSLDTGDAEAAVMETLGLPDDDSSSLFTDYVAGSDSDNETNREKFRYIHQTARVVASMLDEIRENVETSAADSGMDLSGDNETRKAVSKLVGEEVRALLPQISAAVASRIAEIQQTSEFSESEVNLTEAFDPALITDNLHSADTQIDIVDQIESIKNERPPTDTSMQELLTSGMYILDVDCQREDGYDPQDGFEEPSVKPVAVMLSDDGTPDYAKISRDCFGYYTHVKLEGDTMVMQDYYFDPDAGVWQADSEDDYYAEYPDQFILNNGKWEPSFDDEPQGTVEFTENGGVILSTGLGEILVHATTTSLDDTPVIYHLLHRGADDGMSRIVTKADLFPSNSDLHRLQIKRRQQQHVLLNWYSDDDGSGVDYCAGYNQNCNVIDVQDDNGFMPVQTLAEIQTGSLDDFIISEIARDNIAYQPIDLQFSAIKNDDGSLPTEGIVDWILPNQYNPEYIPKPDEECFPAAGSTATTDNNFDDEKQYPCRPYTELEGECDDIKELSTEGESQIDNKSILEGVESEIGKLAKNPIPLTELKNPEDIETYLPCDHDETPVEKLLSNDDSDFATGESRVDQALGESSWSVITVDGVKMIEINIPLNVRHRIDLDDAASMLLIEDDGFIRRGLRLGQKSPDYEMSYSESAFETLRPIVETFISQ